MQAGELKGDAERSIEIAADAGRQRSVTIPADAGAQRSVEIAADTGPHRSADIAADTSAGRSIDVAAGERANRSVPTTDSRVAASTAADEACCATPSRRLRARPWLITGALVVPLALYAGWDWLVATGLATLVVAVAPCLVMCALGLCMHRDKSKGDMSLAEVRKTYGTDSREPPNQT